MTRANDEPRAATDEPRAEAVGPRPAGTARDRAKADRRAALLAAAARLFAERGFDGVTLGDIGEAAGVSGPAVYRHVSGKQALLGAILVDVSERLLEGVRRVAELAAADTTAELRADMPRSATPVPRVAESPRSRAQPASAAPDRRVAESPRSPAHTASTPGSPGTPDAVLRALVDFHVEFALAEADVIRVQDRDLDRLSPDDRRTVRRLQNAYVAMWTEALAAANPDAENPAERRVRALACFGLINSTPHSVRGVPAARVRPTLTRMALAALTA
ncbi:TetR family transcriptional regulator [Microbacterium testaceum]|uniref:TetR family transcriptional regulator n=1 Tax=Microbacterium testaceum TaxID=2033 RepID=UPI001248DF0D|nr:TetR family transcriptional regulator [Microbacterium testaceum]